MITPIQRLDLVLVFTKIVNVEVCEVLTKPKLY
jgi:hypothetical protein